MAELRLVACVVAGVLGCRADAGPTSGLAPPPGWQPLPSIAAAAKKAATDSGLKVDGSEAWGDPARGCYGAWIALQGGGGTPAKMADELIASLSAEPALAGIILRDTVKPTSNADGGVLSLGFERTPYRGRLRAQLAKGGHIAVLACFWNQREPIACEAGCIPLIASMR